MRVPKPTIFGVLFAAAAVACFLLVRTEERPPSPPPAELPSAAPEQPSAAASAKEPAKVNAPPFQGPAAPIDDEHSLMTRIRTEGADPATVLALAREGNRAYPDSPLVEERAQRAIDALVSLNRIGEAHREAELFIERWPTGERAAHVMNLMGVHARPKRADAR